MADDTQAAVDQGNPALVTVAQNAVVALNTLNNTLNTTVNDTLNAIDTALVANGVILSSITTAIAVTLTNAITSTFPKWVTPPANSTASGVSGQVAYSGDGNTTSLFYICFTSGSAGTARWGRMQMTLGF